MTIVNCPECREQVMIPEHVSSQALVQCPLCKAEFRLNNALTQLPPTLIVVEDTASAKINATEANGGFAALDVGDAGQQRTEPTGKSSAPAFQLDSQGTTETRMVRSVRPRRRPFSPVRQFVQIVAGGVAGVVLAQLILWWIPLNLSVENRDLTGAGRKFGRYLPFVVPPSVRNAGLAVEADSDPAGSEFTADAAATPLPEPDTSQIPEFADAHLENGGSAAVATGGESGSGNKAKKGNGRGKKSKSPAVPQAGGEVADPLMDLESPEISTPPTSDADAPLDLEIPDIALESPMLMDGPASVALDETRPGAVGTVSDVGDGLEFRSSDVGLRFSKALSAHVALNTTENLDDQETRNLVRQFYEAFASLGEVLAYVDQSDEKVRENLGDVAELLRALGEDPGKLKIVGAAAASWMGANRPNSGVFVYGQVKAIERQGPYYQTTLQLASRDQRILQIVGSQDPNAIYATGQAVLVLGAILENPKERLAGYTGSANPVVLAGYYYAPPSTNVGGTF